MERYDRLTTLIDRFKLTVAPAMQHDANLVVYTAVIGTPDRALFRTRGTGFEDADEQVLFRAHVDWSGADNPLLTALPEIVEIDLSGDADNTGLVRMMQSEITAQRCGADSVLSRLGEVLIVRMMRALIEEGATQPGLLAGLSDPRLSQAIVAMHDRPGKAWRNEDLAHIAGMSRSRFAERFLAAVGEPPAAYLRRWRLTLALQDITKGDRVDVVARRYGFASSEGFTRAFKKHHGRTPILLRHARLHEAGGAAKAPVDAANRL
ncbi:AraC family transcriptional regulator [Cognatiyoonia sp. IB215446]|uniref:helix-turn-helix transcriptional regulator n=1 Tax=Cognatiyoonia sp. IB215446 TaxID=3097355 RepID=UPI002A0EC1D4|nr:AraC family transcriptional regulator [Cognatiyoonia sp. IB215446]MDX8348000.1 AraC family transcriptional regulator [Cognatiyoonia sp. IB215446]